MSKINWSAAAKAVGVFVGAIVMVSWLIFWPVSFDVVVVSIAVGGLLHILYKTFDTWDKNKLAKEANPTLALTTALPSPKKYKGTLVTHLPTDDNYKDKQ